MQEDLTGRKFGRLTVIELSEKRYSDGTKLWKCQCDCGTVGYYLGRYLKKGITKSCGCLARELSSKRELDDLTGKRFGRLLVIERSSDYVRRDGSKEPRWKCRCDCGNTTAVASGNLKSGAVSSCGCLRKEVDDLSGKRFGFLAVTDLARKEGKRIIWECRCDCGKIVQVDRSSLISGATISCGHVKSMRSLENREKLQKEYIVENTSVLSALKKTPGRLNASGHIGVYKKKNKWAAQISFQKQRYYLGQYDNIEDAIKAREDAEKMLRGPFLEWYANNYPGNWKKLKERNY